MRALILCGGLGTRLRPLVSDRPKALAPIGHRAFLELQIELLARGGIGEVVLCVGYLHEQIESHLGDGGRWGVRLRYSVEDRPLGTGGALKLAQPLVDGPFLALNGDTYFDLDLREFALVHERRQSLAGPAYGTLALVEVADARPFGTVELDADARVSGFREKDAAACSPALVSAGMYVLEPEILDLIPPRQAVSLERDVFAPLAGRPRGLWGHRAAGTFVDMGTPEGYATLAQHLESSPC
jgi:NDP-sugar pyrophosphorylase family protein